MCRLRRRQIACKVRSATCSRHVKPKTAAAFCETDVVHSRRERRSVTALLPGCVCREEPGRKTGEKNNGARRHTESNSKLRPFFTCTTISGDWSRIMARSFRPVASGGALTGTRQEGKQNADKQPPPIRRTRLWAAVAVAHERKKAKERQTHSRLARLDGRRGSRGPSRTLWRPGKGQAGKTKKHSGDDGARAGRN